MKTRIDNSASFDFRVYVHETEVSVLPLNCYAMDWLQIASGKRWQDIGYWAVTVPFAVLAAAYQAGFRIC